MTRRSIDQAALEERLSAIRRCRCEDSGWRLGPDNTPVKPAIRCTHDADIRSADSSWAPAALPAIRDITEPIHQPEDDQ